MTQPVTAVDGEVDELAYRFWSVHPNELDPYAASMPEGYKGGVRAWFYATEIRRLLSAALSSQPALELEAFKASARKAIEAGESLIATLREERDEARATLASQPAELSIPEYWINTAQSIVENAKSLNTVEKEEAQRKAVMLIRVLLANRASHPAVEGEAVATARCCSAVSPCSWQRHHGMDSVCPTCIAATGSDPYRNSEPGASWNATYSTRKEERE